MKFSPERTEPFGPAFASTAGPSFSPDDLTEHETAFLANAVSTMETPASGALLLKARLADLVWLVQEPRKVGFALFAIDSYRAVPLDGDSWRRDGLNCWNRALRLACLCGSGAGDRRQEMEASILDALDSATIEDRFLGVKLAELMKSNGLGRNHAASTATKLESMGRAFASEGDFPPARSYFLGAIHWFKAANNDLQVTAMTAATADCWVEEADQRASSSDPSHAADASHLEKAVQILRTVPHSQREAHDVTKRLKHLQARCRHSGQRAAEEMAAVKSPGVEISEWTRVAREAVTGKSTIDTLKAFVNLHAWSSVDELRNSAIENIRRYPLQHMFPGAVMSRDGRVVAQYSASIPGDTLTDSGEVAIHHQMLRDYNIRLPCVTLASLLPALEVLRLEHRITELDFIELANQAAIVPPGRALLFGKALFAGYDGDFGAALHLLVPQIEHMVLFHLHQAGVVTTHLDSNGIENEKGLTPLLRTSQSSGLFGSDVIFELSALFTNPAGPNLGNMVAHGLLSDIEALFSAHAIYAWWLTLKLVLADFWNTVAASEEEMPETDAE